MNHQHSSPPLPNLHSLSISPTYGVQSEYPYNGVFGPPVATPPGPPQRGWTSSPKRGSRSGIPQAWFDTQPRDLGNHYDAFRRDTSSPPTLSPPSSTASGATPAQPYYPAFALEPFPSMGLAPSPPPQIPYGMATPASAGGYGNGMYGSAQIASMQQRAAAVAHGQWRGVGAMPTADDDVIPTAIVIKNIPFAVSRETLLAIIESLGAPLPYAFNYHHDNGVFRGLAFANFRQPEEAASVVAALNGYDVQGRKLRVEYKKVLQPGEKDRIEREKAIKRMKSMQIDAVAKAQASPSEPPPPLSANAVRSNGHHHSFMDSSNESPPHSATSASSESLPTQLDLNDPSQLNIYTMVFMFKEDRMRDELVLSRNLSPTERRIVHLVAQKLSLTSVTKTDGDCKYVVVTKDKLPSSSTTSFLSPAYGDGPQPHLRIKKSMPDLRGFNGPVVARDPARSLAPQRSSGNLRADAAGGLVAGRDYASMGVSQGRRMNGHGFNNFFGTVIGGVPPVPPLPASLTSPSNNNNNNNDNENSQPMRNPRGPVGEGRGFVMRPAPNSLRGVPAGMGSRHLNEGDDRAREELDL